MLRDTNPTLAPNPIIQNRRRRRHRHGYGRIHYDAKRYRSISRSKYNWILVPIRRLFNFLLKCVSSFHPLHPLRRRLGLGLRAHPSTLFLFLAGITEAISYRTYKVHINLMTGNTIRCLDSLSNGNYNDVAILVSVIMCYVLGGVIFDQLSLWRIRKGRKGGDGETANMPFSRSIIDMNMDGKITGNDEHEHDGQAKDKASNSPDLTICGISIVFFFLSDVMGLILSGLVASDVSENNDKGSNTNININAMATTLKLPFLSMSFGLSNAIAYDMFGYVIHSITGLYDAIGRRSYQDLQHWQWRSRRFWTWFGSELRERGRGDRRQEEEKRNGKSGRDFGQLMESLGGFLTGLLMACHICNWLEANNPSGQKSHLGDLFSKVLPPLGTSFGIAHALLYSYAHHYYRNSPRHDRYE